MLLHERAVYHHELGVDHQQRKSAQNAILNSHLEPLIKHLHICPDNNLVFSLDCLISRLVSREFFD